MSAKPRHSLQSALSFTALTVFACLVLSACSSLSNTSSAINPVNWLTPYKIDVIQGNFVSREQVGQLKVGMPRAEVKELMGTPLVASLFHADRWDYVFTLKRQGAEYQSYKYTVYFKGDELARFEGDEMPSEAEFITKLDNKRKLGKVPVLEATEEQMLKAAEKTASKSGQSGAAAATAFPTGSPTPVYPPLESAKQ